MKKLFFLGLFFACVWNSINAQDPHFSQIQYNPLYLNPSYAGFGDKDNRFVGMYRDQWRTVPVPFMTAWGSYDRCFICKPQKYFRFGGGVSFLFDRAGDGLLSTFNPNITLAVSKGFAKGRFWTSFGATAGMTIKSLDYGRLTFDNQYIVGTGYVPGSATGETFSNNNVSFANFGLGLNLRYKFKKISYVDLGGTIWNPHQPKQNFLYFTESRLPMRYGAYTKARIELGKKEMWNLQPGFFFNRQNKVNNMLLNAIAEMQFAKSNVGLGFGAGYRFESNDAAIAYLSVLYKGLRVGASYDINVSKFTKATRFNGAFELLLSYEFGEKACSKKCPELPKCPACPPYENTEVEIKVKQRDNDSLLATFKKSFEADTIPQTYLDSLYVSIPKVEKPMISEIVLKMLPLTLYFHNDIPKTGDNTNYEDLYTAYVARMPEYKEKSIDDDARVDEFFTKVETNYNNLNKVIEEINAVIKKGYTVDIEFRGYASPLAPASYNKALTERRISSIMNLFKERMGANYDKISKTTLPLGKSVAKTGISDKLSEPSKSIFGIDASSERKVEIVGIRLYKE